MNKFRFLPSQNRDLATLLLLIVGLVIFYHIGLALTGHFRYRDQHLGTALNYTNTRFDLKHTVIVGFNATDAPTIQELPIWQMAAGFAIKCFGSWWGWANVISLLLFLSCLYPLYQVAQKFYGDRAAWWALIFFLSQALIFLYAGEAGTDGFCLSISLWFYFACMRLMEEPLKWFFPALCFGALTAVSKVPFFMAMGLAAFLMAAIGQKCRVRNLINLATVGIISGILFVLWTRYTDSIQAQAIFPYVDLRLGSASKNGMTMTFWYFGDWHYRLSVVNWIKAVWRFMVAGFGSFPILLLFLLGLADRRQNSNVKFLFGGAFLTTLVFTHLILHHYNYLMLYSPSVAIFCAIAWERIERWINDRGFGHRSTAAIAAIVLLLALLQGLIDMKAFTFDSYPALITAAIRDHTSDQDRLVIINGGWGGDELIRARRSGLSMWDASYFNDLNKYSQLKKLGFNKIVIVSESPYMNAIEIVNPGQTGIPRIMAKSFLTPLIEEWPTTYATDDVIIKVIP